MNKRNYHQGCGVRVWLYINFLKIKILTLETLLLSRLTLYLCAEQDPAQSSGSCKLSTVNGASYRGGANY